MRLLSEGRGYMSIFGVAIASERGSLSINISIAGIALLLAILVVYGKSKEPKDG